MQVWACPTLENWCAANSGVAQSASRSCPNNDLADLSISGVFTLA
jgi:hypothetical protein